MKKHRYRYNTLQNLLYLFKGAFQWQPLIILCTLVFAIFEGLKDLVWVYGSKIIIEMLSIPHTGIFDYKNIVYVVIVVSMVEFVFFLGIEVSKTTASSRITDVRCQFILLVNKKVMNMPLALLENPEIYLNKRKADAATAGMTEGLEGILRETAPFLAGFITILISAIILWNMHPLLVVIMFLLATIRGILHDRMTKKEKEEFIDPMNYKQHELNYYFWTASNFEFAKDIRIFQMKEALCKRQRQAWDIIQSKYTQLNKKWRKTLLTEEYISLLQEGILYLWLLYTVFNQDMSVADFILYMGSVRSFNYAVGIFLEKWTMLVRFSREICDYRDFLDYPEEEVGRKVKSCFENDYKTFINKNVKEKYKVPIPKDGKYEICFENVSFSYPGSKHLALRELNITLKSGERLAVVGINGAGKSTFIKLLCGLYKPTQGIIYLNGQDICQFDRTEYFKLIAPVFQNVECFAATIAENVSMQLSYNTDKEKVISELNKAGLSNKIGTLEKGIDAELLKFLHIEGVELSGGERQKMALARALYKNAPIIVLDEPTAALDALAEYKTYMEFDSLIGNKTAIYISHRLSSTRFCHHVAMFENGKMIEYGTHEELLLAGASYAQMFTLQARYYKENEGDGLGYA